MNRRLFSCVCAPMLTLAGNLQAAETAQARPISSVWELIRTGGWTMAGIVLLSVLAVALIIYFLLTIREEIVFPARFIHKAETLAAAGDIQGVRDLCLADDSAAAKVLLAALEQLEMDKHAAYDLLSAAMEDEGTRQAGLLWQRIQYLLDVAVVAPMMGLLGTVLGMIQAFSSLQAELGSVIPLSLAQGVAKALVTTAGGLAVGIPAMLIYAVFRGRVLSLVAGLETAGGRVMRRLWFAVNGKERPT